MTRLNLILLPSMLALSSPAWPAGTKAAHPRPLNLSLPHDVLKTPAQQPVDETVARNLRAPAPPRGGADAPPPPVGLPYGTGYEHRHQEFGGAAAGAGAGAGAAGGGGAGRRGR